MEIEWIAKLKIFLLPLSHLKPHRRRIKKAAPYYSNQVVCTILNYIFNESLNFHHKLACKIFFPILSTIKFYFSSSSLENLFFISLSRLSRRLVVCMLCGEKCLCKHWECLIFSFDCVAACTRLPRLLFQPFSWCAAVLGVCVVHFYFEERQGRRKHSERERMWKKQTENIVQVSAFTRHNS